MTISLRKTEETEIDWIMQLEVNDDLTDFIRGNDAATHREKMVDSHTLYLTIQEDARNVGFAILRGVHTEDRNIEVGRIVIGPKNRGIGQSALKALLRYAFEEMGANRVSLDTLSYNERARHIYKKLGFVEEGTRRKAFFLKNEFHDLILFGMLRDEWEG